MKPEHSNIILTAIISVSVLIGYGMHDCRMHPKETANCYLYHRMTLPHTVDGVDSNEYLPWNRTELWKKNGDTESLVAVAMSTDDAFYIAEKIGCSVK